MKGQRGRSSSPPAHLQVQARALGSPTRHAIFRYVAATDRAVGVAELTEHLRLNHNTIRQHLAKLTAAALLVEEHAPSTGRGRPRLQYRLRPDVDSRWGATAPYERLSRLLAEMIRSGDSAVDVGRRSVAGHGGADALGDDPIAFVVDTIARAGFEPSVRGGDSRKEVVLHACPFAAVARDEPDTVCAIHLGIAHGTAELTGGRVIVEDLVVGNPRRADPRCRLWLHLEQPETP